MLMAVFIEVRVYDCSVRRRMSSVASHWPLTLILAVAVAGEKETIIQSLFCLCDITFNFPVKLVIS